MVYLNTLSHQNCKSSGPRLFFSGLCLCIGMFFPPFSEAQQTLKDTTGVPRVAPDSGELWRQSQPSPVPPQPVQGKTELKKIEATPEKISFGGKTVALRGFRLVGNKIISSAELYSLLPPEYTKGSEFRVGIPDVDKVTDTIADYYRQRGYFVALSYAAPQAFSDQILTLTILEGVMDKLAVDNKSGSYDTELLQRFASNNFCDERSLNCAKELLLDKNLERATGIVSDLPGVGLVSSLLAPGTTIGTSGVTLKVNPGKSYYGSLSADNYGNKYVSTTRLRGDFNYNNFFGIGDQINVNLLTSPNTKSLSGGLGYSQPIGYSGLRAGIGFNYGTYKLGDAFANLGAEGNSSIISPFLSYPIIRSREHNLYLRASYDYKQLDDRVGSVESSKKTANGYSLGLSGNLVDRLYGVNFNSYGLTFSSGNVSQTSGNAGDQNSLGSYQKISYNLVRDQFLANIIENQRLSLFASIYGQTTTKNLVSSEKIGLGGPSGVRAFPNGEAGGDIGIVGSLELRYAMALGDSHFLTTALFKDRGWVKTDAVTPQGATASTYIESRILSGTGLSVSLSNPNLYALNLVYAVRDDSKAKATSDDSYDGKRFWVQGSLYF